MLACVAPGSELRGVFDREHEVARVAVVVVGTDRSIRRDVVHLVEDVVEVDRQADFIADLVTKARIPDGEARRIELAIKGNGTALAVETAAKAAPATPADKVTTDMVLQAVPKLRMGDWLPISDAAKALHDQKLLSKSASSPKLFKRFPQSFELKPEKQPASRLRK